MMENKKIFMNLMTDFAFKRLFGTPERKRILIRFLNILFSPEGLRIDDVDYHDKEILPEDETGKRIVYDIYCTTQGEKQHIILEMQQAYHDFFENRTVFYSSKAISKQGKRGWNYDLKPVYTIFFVDFHFPHMTRKGMHDVRLVDVHSHEIYSNVMRLIFLHLDETKKNWDDCQTDYDKILFLIKNIHTMDKNSKAYLSGEFEDLFKESEIRSMAAEDAVAYGESYQKYVDTMAAMDYAARDSFSKGLEKGMEKGMEQGIEKGLAQGIEKGLAQGMEKGLAQGMEEERVKSIRFMLELGVSAEVIAQKYGISVEEVLRFA